MTAKRPAKKAPAKAGAKPKNKQRLTKLTRRERVAATNGGWLDERLPEPQLRQWIEANANSQGCIVDLDPVLTLLARQVGWVRLMADPELARMAPSEIAQQGVDTIAVIDELIERMTYMHPDLEAHATAILFKANNDAVLYLKDRISPELYRLRGAITHVVQMIRSQPAKRGEKHSERKTAKARVAEALLSHSQPGIPKKLAGIWADELLELCGFPNPKGTR